ncbi:tRNA-specific adenosine deaminase 1 [Aricia agestis]|uniref:tRNA-specific adenosine deaminase 1 n=1 Tax=Aricia agestis TaxID=91739 RepID=UPI001C2048DC|nr:tRNA-specific adenosine deaminase 1 [Aricia agestis]
MDNLNDILVDKIVRDCISLYNSLPKSGKPSDGEWTVLSCVIQYGISTQKWKIVSLGTGSKCIGASKMSPMGNVLNDSHAEVIARRGFLLYLYENLLNAYRNKESIFEVQNRKVSLKKGISFIFYSSQLPCGDASIIPKSDEECFGDVLASKKHKLDSDEETINNPKCPKIEDIHRTGAKCLPDQIQDSRSAGKEYHVVGQVRTKPGRGERTLSVSCSDKIARWIHVGIQGGLLGLLLAEPIFMSHFIFGAGVPYSKDTLERAFFYRTNEDKNDVKQRPILCQSSIKFHPLKSDERSKAASGSIICVNTSSRVLEVTVQGKKLGVTKKKENSPSSFLSVCKYSLFKKFQEVLNENEDLKSDLLVDKKIENIKYNEVKNLSQKYMESWKLTKESIFKTWTKKPDMWNFSIKEFK